MTDRVQSADWRKSTYSNASGDCVEVATWRKSSHSTAQGECVEVGIAWRKASHSNSSGACIEVGSGTTAVLVRDTTNRSGPTLVIPAPAWRALLAEVRAC
jgi:hypothetical protein